MRKIAILLFLLINIQAFASPKDSIVERIFNEMYNQHYTQAEEMLHANQNNIDSIFFAVLSVDMSYWKNVTGTNSPNYETFENDLQRFSLINTTTSTQQAIHLVTLSYQLRYELKRFKLIKAISTRQETKALFTSLKTNEELPPEQQELYQLYSALFQYFDNYLKPFFVANKKENCNEALTKMTQLYQSENRITKTLVAYFLGKTWLKYENDPENAIEYFQWLHKRYPENIKFEELLAECNEQLN
ncbi:hypothetical protein SLH46_02205 [Draconibacterium sp. IB214405]|uniref:hypothetical protein n=1 Tax=Draconibacterium sp. IB214405 TaxID=3097352 RepID=UPI002A13E2A4|nr:hypothetical protein [Draconibacterium sp. IB214405]MDX8337977.1 hypothetical protein [Draconibacterium sp. IB214405]